MAVINRRWKQKNKERLKEYQYRWRQANKEKVRTYQNNYNRSQVHKDSKKKYLQSPQGILKTSHTAYVCRLRSRYGLSLEQYESMLEKQGGKCAICRGNRSERRRLAVDHSHETSTVRELLCVACNRILGFADENPEILRAAIKYLDRHTAIAVESVT